MSIQSPFAKFYEVGLDIFFELVLGFFKVSRYLHTPPYVVGRPLRRALDLPGPGLAFEALEINASECIQRWSVKPRTKLLPSSGKSPAPICIAAYGFPELLEATLFFVPSES